MKKKKINFFKLIVFLILLAGLFCLLKNFYMQLPYKEVTIEIEEGTGTKEIAKILKENGIIRSSLLFMYDSKKSGYDTKFRYGTFELNTSMNEDEIMEVLSTKGAMEKGITVTIPEGYTLKQIAQKLEEANLVKQDDFYKAMKTLNLSDYEFLNGVPSGDNYLEGYMFPDTYEFKVDSTPEEVIRKFLDRFNKNFKLEDVQKAKNLGYTYHEVIIVASIIEREVKLQTERAKVAGVVYNRLANKQKLEMCSTIQYILGEQHAKLYEVDLQIDSPYNTYMYIGLPIGPISNPGSSAIEAALNPEVHDYLYFVLMDETTGQHYFSKTYAEHVGAKSKYIK